MKVSQHPTLIAILCVIACSLCLARNQTPSSRPIAASGRKLASTDQLSDIKKRDATLGTTAKKIAEENPDTVSELGNDADVILKSRRKVFAALSSAGYDKESQQKAEAYVWKDVRLEILQADQSLDQQRWETQMAHRGRLAVSSTPEKAYIYVDNGRSALNRSNNFIFPTAGSHRICLKLQGYQDYCEDRDIQYGIDNTPITAQLTKAQ